MSIHPDPKILISLGIFHAWLDRTDYLLPLNSALNSLLVSNKMHGVEFSLPFAELEQWSNRLGSGKKILPNRFRLVSEMTQHKLLKLPTTCLHFESFERLPLGKEKWLSEIMSVLVKVGIKSFTVHPDTILPERWSEIMSSVPKQAQLSIENMDKRTRSFKTLKEMENLLNLYPQLNCTFDICHWLEHSSEPDYQELKTFISTFQARINKVHYSVPKSESAAYQYFNKAESNHYLFSQSGALLQEDIFAGFSEDIAWIIEGSVPVGNLSLLEAEIKKLEELQQSRENSVLRTKESAPYHLAQAND